MPNNLSSPVLFSGQEDYTLDAKGRVTIPRNWRAEAGEGEAFHLVPDSKGACLRVMRPDRFVQFGEEARVELKMDAKTHRLFMRNFFANSTPVTTDKQGRIMIPRDYCERLKLSGEIRLLGCGDLIEIWNHKALAACARDEASSYQQATEALGL